MKAAVLTSTERPIVRPLRIVEVPRPEPGAAQVLLRVRACGVCRTTSTLSKESSLLCAKV